MTKPASSLFARLRDRRRTLRVAAAAGALVTATGLAGIAAVAGADESDSPTPVSTDQGVSGDQGSDQVDVPGLHDAIVAFDHSQDGAGDDDADEVGSDDQGDEHPESADSGKD